MSVPQALSTPVDVTVESLALSPRNGFHLEPRCRVCRNDSCVEKSTTCWPPGPATPWSCAHSRKTTPSWTSVIGSRSTRSEPTARSTSQFNRLATPRTGRSWSGGLGRTRSTSSRGWPRRLTPFAYFERRDEQGVPRPGGRSHTEVSVETGLRAARVASVRPIDGGERGTEVLLAEGPAGLDPDSGQVDGAGGDVGRDHREDRGV